MVEVAALKVKIVCYDDDNNWECYRIQEQTQSLKDRRICKKSDYQLPFLETRVNIEKNSVSKGNKQKKKKHELEEKMFKITGQIFF